MNRVRVILLNAALGPLDYRVPKGIAVEPGSIVLAPLGPRQITGVVWEAERLPAEEVDATTGCAPCSAPTTCRRSPRRCAG